MGQTLTLCVLGVWAEPSGLSAAHSHPTWGCTVGTDGQHPGPGQALTVRTRNSLPEDQGR